MATAFDWPRRIGELTSRARLAGIGVAFGMLAAIGTAAAYDEAVVSNCADDYFTYCKQHSPESLEVRYCMEAHRNELSKQCVKALVDAGEVPRKYLTKKASDRN